MPDQVDEVTPASTPVDTGGISELVSAINASSERTNEALMEALKSKAAPPAGPSREETLNAAFTTFREKCAEGEYDEGLKAVVAAIGAPGTSDPSADPGYIALKEAALDRAERKHADVMDKWRDEVEEELDKLPPTERINSVGIRKAVAAVKNAHIDDILAAAREEQTARIREEMAQPAPQGVPYAPLGETKDTALHGLTVDQRRQARDFGVTYEEFAAQVKLGGSKPREDSPMSILGDSLPVAGGF